MEIIFSDIMYILHHNTSNFCILVIFHTFFTFEINVKLKVKNPYVWFSMEIDHSNP